MRQFRAQKPRDRRGNVEINDGAFNLSQLNARALNKEQKLHMFHQRVSVPATRAAVIGRKHTTVSFAV